MVVVVISCEADCRNADLHNIQLCRYAVSGGFYTAGAAMRPLLRSPRQPEQGEAQRHPVHTAIAPNTPHRHAY